MAAASVSKHDFVISCGGVMVSNSFLLSNCSVLRLGCKELECEMALSVVVYLDYV